MCVLEEPEHLNWYHGGRNWRRHFKLVLGVVHTNYIGYARMYQPQNVWVVRLINQLVCRAYCDRLVKLSDCLQRLPRASVCNVHGVRAEFVAEGERIAADAAARRGGGGGRTTSSGAYFIGKMLWAKGYRLLIEYLKDEEQARGTQIDLYGEGEDKKAVEAEAQAAGLSFRFCGARDHAHADLRGYSVFVNPSRTEVLSTTTAEALAMGKWVVIERLPENEFFYAFSNALVFETPEQFRAALRKALSEPPAPLGKNESRALSWAGATERFLGEVAAASRLAKTPHLADETAHCSHLYLLGAGFRGWYGDAIRKFVFESGPVARQRWLNREKRYRESRSVVEVVDKSVAVCPATTKKAWDDKYSSAGAR